MQEKKELLVLSPFETPDINLVSRTLKSGAFPVLHLGRDVNEAQQALKDLSQKTDKPFGVAILSEAMASLQLPSNVTKIILPLGVNIENKEEIELLYQVHSLEEIDIAVKNKYSSIVLKGNESTGKVAQETSFILFQAIKKNYPQLKANIYVQGGVGVHTGAALLAMGAKGVILDNQVALFPECSTPQELKNMFSRFSGNETMLVDNFRFLVRKNSPTLPTLPKFKDIEPYLGGLDLSANFIPMGQDIAISTDLVETYKTIDNLVTAFYEAAYGHLLQAKKFNIIGENSSLAKDLKIKYPIAQGPMARISDVPEFANEVAKGGGLPFLAMSVMVGKPVKDMLAETEKLLDGKPWGVGLLGFMPQKLREEQNKYIFEHKPSAIVLSGGRPSQAKQYEKEGIKVFLHVPSTALLDMFLKEGAKNFIFEGRECGGHLGPISSFVLWEKQIHRLLKEDSLHEIAVFFAGGIHDDISSAFISIMSTTLAAKGAKLGAFMGSSYLYTKEAVETGAIVPEYQRLSLEQKTTVELEAVPGQETRALDTPFTSFFTKEKERLFSQNLDSKEVWIKLEELNIGRLRIASKGEEFVDIDKTVTLDAEEQHERGLYMMGQVAALQNSVHSIKDLHKQVAIDNNTLISQLEDLDKPQLKEPIKLAIVGMSGIFPQAKNIEEYWKNILLGKDCVTEVPDDRWNKKLFYNPDTRDSDYVHSKWGGFIPDIEFDPLEFGIPPQSLAAIEPVQLLSLYAAKRALEDAGYDLKTYNGERTSVIIGTEGATELAASYGFRGYAKQVLGELPEELKNKLPKLTEDSFPGVLSNVVAGRITNRLNLGGSNFTVDAACASSLAALDIASQELQNKRSDVVIVGGADFHNGLNDFLMFSSTYALSRKGYCASFDAGSDGIALGEGIGMIILKRLEDAELDGDRIYAVLRGTGGASDGKSLGMTAPNKKGQMNALRRAYKNAGVLPSEIDLIEAHGTGTVVGDKTELSALTELFLESGAVPGQTHLGSVKTQVGHTKCAAGIAGLIKAALATYYGIKPPTIHLNNPNSFYDKEKSPFIFNTEAGLWNKEKRISGVSGFGFGGTNFHAVLENYNSEVTFPIALPSLPSELFVFRGDSIEEAKGELQKTKTLLESQNYGVEFKNIAYSLAVYNKKYIQISIVANDEQDLLNKINSALTNKTEDGVYIRNNNEGKVAFLFSGQGSQRVNMARDLFVAFPAMRKLLAKNPEYESIIFPHAVFDDESKKEQQANITKTQNAQPLLGIVDLAIADFLRSLNIVPDVLAGHSYGELPALSFSGVFSPEELVSLSEKRAESILKAVGNDKGMMAAINLPENELKEVLKDEKEVWAVNFNSQKQTILAGSTEAMTSFIAKMKENKILVKDIPVDCAFHSPLLSKSQNFYAKELEDIKFNSPSIPVWSNTTAEVYPTKTDDIKSRLAEHLVKPVLFKQQLEGMYADGARIFIEAGPGRVLINLAQTVLDKEIVTIQTEDKTSEGIGFLLNAIAKYISTGRDIDIEKLFEKRNTSVINIDKPELYKRNPVVWYINGHYARPTVGKMPSTGAYPIAEPLQLGGLITSSNNISSVGGGANNLTEADNIMLEYLRNMKSMMQTQRDVMLGYFGQPIPAQTIEAMPTETRTVSPTTAHQANGVQNQPIQAQTKASAPATPSIDLSLDNIKSLLLETVSEKTGYPIDMLGLEMDLEADLSIDSIKRMEIIGALREKLNITSDMDESEDAIEKMASIKTLNGVIGWVEELISSAQALNTITNHAPGTTETTIQNVPSTTFSVEEIKALLLETVSEKTGYPLDMLGLDMDLEADLSIDSIKRMEVIGALKEKLNIASDMDESEDAIEKMASIKTLRGMIDWVDELANENKEKLPPSDKKPEIQNNNSVSYDISSISDLEKELIKDVQDLEKEELVRVTFELEDWKSGANKLAVKDNKFAITNDGGAYAKKIKAILEENGASADIIDNNTKDLSSYNGLILLDITNASIKQDISEAFTLVKNANLENIKWIYSFTDIIGDLNNKKEFKQLKLIKGISGFVKSLAREFSNINCRVILAESVLNEDEVSKIILEELKTTDEASEIVYKDAKRMRYKLISSELNINGTSKLSLDKDSVVLVLGGAQGITAELTHQLSNEYPCHYILVGRTAVPTEEDKKYIALKDQTEIRKHLISEEKMTVPAEIEKKVQHIFKANQIIKSIESIEKSGSEVTYKSLDVTNETGLRDLIKGIYADYNRLDGVIHAAGLLIDKLFNHKTLEAFNQVYSTKIVPLHILIEELRPDVKFLVFFSSITSVYGNRGQVDYAAANSVFDIIAHTYSNKTKARILTVNWGPWKGAGMVSSALEGEFKKRGVPLIPLKEGGERFVNELKYGNDSQVLIMGGNEVQQFFGI